jgi:hypothetical protein
MTVSSSSRKHRAAAAHIAAALGLAIAAAAPASAQDSGPLLLTPWPTDTDPTGASSGGTLSPDLGSTQPGSSLPPAGSPTPTATEPAPLPAPEGERAPEGITVNALDEISTDYGGTLEPDDGGFGYDMWAGTDRALVEQYLPQIPIQPLSPAMRDLARRLLLSTAEPPAGSVQRNLMTIRAELLGRLGNAADIADFLELVRADQFDAALARLQVDALLLDGRRDEACAAVRNHIVSFDADPYLQKAFAFCQMVAGERIPAMLAADLLYEQGEEDAAFYDLMAALDGATDIAVETLPAPSALHLAMLEAAKLPPPADLVATADPLILGALARNESLDPASPPNRPRRAAAIR